GSPSSPRPGSLARRYRSPTAASCFVPWRKPTTTLCQSTAALARESAARVKPTGCRNRTPIVEGLQWFLLTDLPIATSEEIAFAVDCYRARWTIEEYFKALKTGCQYEKRQLESAHSLLNALAVLAPVAWRLLLLRYLARHAPDRPATDALTPKQLEVLQAVAKRPLPTR